MQRNEMLLPKKNKPSSACSWVSAQYFYNITNTMLKSFTLATFFTDLCDKDLCDFDEAFWGISYPGLGIALAISMFFAYCESTAHSAESEHFNHSEHDSENDDLEAQASNDPSTHLSIGQKICQFGHYASDIIEGTQAPLFISKMAGIDRLSYINRTLCYAGMGLYSLFGNYQEFKNTQVAFLKANQRAAKETKESNTPDITARRFQSQ